MMVFRPSGLNPPKSGNLRLEAERRKDLDNVLGHLRKMAENSHHGLALKDIDISKGYIRGDFYVRLIAAPANGWVSSVSGRDCSHVPQIRYNDAFFQIARTVNHDPDLGISNVQALEGRWVTNGSDRDE